MEFFYFFCMNLKNILFLFFVFTNFIFAQTKVSGTVVDAKNLPISYATVSFKGTSENVLCDKNGVFKLESSKNYNFIECSRSGYSDKEIRLKNPETSALVIQLQEAQELQTVVMVRKPKKHLSKKDNPAYRILKGIWANKKKNGLQLAKTYDYKKYTSLSMGLSNLDSLFLKKLLGKSHDSIIKIVEQDEKQKNYFIPIFLRETNEAVYGNNILKKEKIDIEAERTIGVRQDGFIYDRISNAFSPFDVYQDDILILNKPFVSPISERGYGIYEYVLKDSIIENNKKSYHIYFFPRQAGELAFEGSFKVMEKNFALTFISMRANKGINLNLVRDLFVEKSFEIINDSLYLPNKDYYEGDFTILSKDDKEKGLFIRKNIVFSDYDLNAVHDDAFYDKNIMQTRAKQFQKDDSYWNSVLSKDPSLVNTRKIIDNLEHNSKVKSISNTINIISTGYAQVLKNLQIGSFWQLFSGNNIEGLRLRFGVRSFKTVDDLFRIYAYTAYGVKDRKLKFGFEARYLAASNPRLTLGLTHVNDNLQLGGLTLNVNDLLSPIAENLIINRGNNYDLARVIKTALNVDFGFTNNFHVNISAIQRRIKSADDEFFKIDYSYDPTNIEKRLIDFTTNVTVAYTPERQVYGFGVDQRFGRNLFSTYILKYTRGFKNVMGGQFNFNKLQMSYSKPILLSNFGILRSYIEVGKTFETLPMLLLNPVPANQAYSLIANTFSLLDYYDMMTDQYIMYNFNHHLNGLIFNRVPYLKKLKLREVLFYRGIYGTVSQANIDINRSNIQYLAPSNKVYGEYGFGIENIGYGNLRPLRLDFIWRTNFENINGTEPPKFGIRLGFNPDF